MCYDFTSQENDVSSQAGPTGGFNAEKQTRLGILNLAPKLPMDRVFRLMLLFCALTMPALAAEPVKDALTAEKIGADALKAKIGNENYTIYMRDLSWQAQLRGDYWFAMPVIPTNIGSDLMSQDGWIVQIDQRDGKVLGVYLQF